MSLEALRIVLIVELTLLALLLVTQAGTALRDLRRRRIRPLLDTARARVLTSIVSDRIDADTVEVLGDLRGPTVDDLLCSIAVGVQNAGDPVFGELADLAGTTARIERDLQSRAWWVRRAALRRLSALGMRHDAADELLHDPDPRVRATATQTLALASPNEATAARLIVMLDDDDQRVRHAATTALFRLGSASTQALRAGLETGSDRVRRQTIRVMAALADPSTESSIRPLIDHADPEIQAEAIRAVAPMLTDADTDMVEARLTHPEARVRRAATEAAGRAGLRRLVGSVARRMDDDDGDVREIAVAALEQMGPGGELLLRRAVPTVGATRD
jgi:HEAT repeat protein